MKPACLVIRRVETKIYDFGQVLGSARERERHLVRAAITAIADEMSSSLRIAVVVLVAVSALLTVHATALGRNSASGWYCSSYPTLTQALPLSHTAVAMFI